MISVRQAAHLQALMEQYTLAEYECGHYTAMAYCANVQPTVVNMAKGKLRTSPANRLHDLLMKEIAQLTDWSAL